MLRGLSRVADIDFLWLTPRSDDVPPAPAFIDRLRAVRFERLPTGLRGHAGWLSGWHSGVVPRPYEARISDNESVARAIESMSDSCDLVFFSEPVVACAAWPWFRTTNRTSIVDFYDIEHERLEQELELLRARHPGWTGYARSRYQRFFIARNARSWRFWTDEVARAATTCLVTKQDDVRSLAPANAVVIPNGADVGPQRPLAARSGPPRIVLTGTLGYEPNLDAVHFLIDEIRPRLVEALGDHVSIRIVGEIPEALRGLKADDVQLTGYVEDIEDEVRSADLVVVPVRFGSGTRLKVLEAFALGTPVVSTSIGCEGLDVEDSVHLWIADAPDAFATRCAAVIADPVSAAKMTTRARQLVVEKYDWRAIEEQVATLAAAQITS